MSPSLDLKCDMIRPKPVCGTLFPYAGLSLDLSKSCPGTMPIDAIFSTIGASAAVGGFLFNSSANKVKYSLASILLTWSRTEVFMSIAGSTLPCGGFQSLPQALRGASFTSSCSLCTSA
ncbi:hypothetical protein D3C72_1620780 [compost metagenome]